MNTTPDPNRDKLDRLLDETLGNLPEYEAPEDLLTNIMARVVKEEERQNVSWYTTLRWPAALASAGCVFLGIFFSSEIHAYFSRLIPVGRFTGGIETVNTVIQILGAISNALGKVLGLIPPMALYSIAALVVAFFACTFAGMGTALFRLTRQTVLINS